VCAVLKELGADWRKPEIVFDLPEDCQSKAGTQIPRLEFDALRWRLNVLDLRWFGGLERADLRIV